MKSIKKTISLFLCFLLLLSVTLCQFTASAANQVVLPIKATPVNYNSIQKNWNINHSVYTAQTTPLAFTSAKGAVIGNSTQIDGYGSNYVGLMTTDNPISLADSSAVIMYVKLDSANTVQPQISLTQESTGLSWNPDMTLMVGSSYQYMAIGDSEWTDGVVTDTINTNGRQYDGIIAFGAAFEGYIKISYDQLKCDSLVLNPAKHLVRGFFLKAASVGGEKGNMTFGPVFSVNADSSSVKIDIPAEYRISAVAATPLAGWTKSTAWWQYRKLTELQPLSFTTAKGVKIEGNADAGNPSTSVDFGNMINAKAYLGLRYDSKDYAISSTTGVLFYIKTENANDVLFDLNVVNAAGSEYTYSSKVGSSYQYMRMSDSKWTSAAFAAGGKADSTFWGTFGFDGAFEGYVKIPYTSLVHDGGRKLTPESDMLYALEFKLRGLGDTFGSMVIAPAMLITADSDSPDIAIPEEYKTAPSAATPLTGYQINPVGSQVTAQSVKPFKYDTTADGILFSSKDSAEHTYEYGRLRFNGDIRSSMFFGIKDTAGNVTQGAPYSLEETSGLVFYVKTDSANSLLLSFNINCGWSYQPEMTLKEGNTFAYLPLGSDEWETAVVGAGGDNSDSSNAVNNFGTIDFGGAFEGLIKIPYTSLYNDSNIKINPAVHTLSSIELKLGGIGGSYGNVTIGPASLITNDTDSVRFVIPDEYKPGSVEATALTGCGTYNWNYKTITEEKVTPIPDVTSMPGLSPKAANGTGIANASDTDIENSQLYVMYTYSDYDENDQLLAANYADLSDSTGFMFYVKTTAANAFVPEFSVDVAGLSWDPGMALKIGSSYSYMAVGDTEWTNAAVTKSGWNKDNGYFGLIEFDKAFEGYIKINYDQLTNDSHAVFNKITDKLSGVAFHFRGVGEVDGVDYGSLTFGPVFKITKDSVLTSLSVTTPALEKGDINGDCFINTKDIVLLRKYLLGVTDGVNATRCDVNGDTAVNIKDLISFKKLLAKAV